jgi:hypothetical protein
MQIKIIVWYYQLFKKENMKKNWQYEMLWK